MKNTCRLKISQAHFELLHRHLFPGDGDEHGAVLKAGVVEHDGELVLLVREVHLAREGLDYRPGRIGYRVLDAQFIHRHIVAARDERLAYLAVHNHGSDEHVEFSAVDLQSHERGYPALRDIAAGMPVGALVLGLNSMQADVWMPDGRRLRLTEAVIVGPTIRRLHPRPPRGDEQAPSESFERQVRMIGTAGQRVLGASTIGVIGLGGVGSMVCEYLARLGVGHLLLVDGDEIEQSNLSRVVGATQQDVLTRQPKVAIAERIARQAVPKPRVTVLQGDFAHDTIASHFKHCDYLFLAADSMRARLVFNAMVHQYLIPGVQLGAKVARQNRDLQAWSAIRPVRPGQGCLWCNGFIDPTELAIETKSDEERKAQAYGVREPNPSVLSLNAVAAAHGVNEFLFDYLAIRPPREYVEYQHLASVGQAGGRVQPRSGSACPECSAQGHRYARGDMTELPTLG